MIDEKWKIGNFPISSSSCEEPALRSESCDPLRSAQAPAASESALRQLPGHLGLELLTIRLGLTALCTQQEPGEQDVNQHDGKKNRGRESID